MTFDGRLVSGVSVLAAVVEGGSFVKAAEALGLSASGVSRAIGRLEARIGVRLLDRTTRSLHLTDEGRRFYQQVAPLLEGIEEAAIQASGSSTTVRGRLRVNVDPFFARLVLAPRLAHFIARYPELEIELITRDELGDLVGVCVTFRASGSLDGEHARAQKLYTRATIHRSLEGFQSVDLPLGLTIAPWLCDCIFNGVNVSMKNPCKSFY